MKNSSQASISRAWCEELNAEVTISQARREYLSLETPPAKFTFYCNDPACLTLPTRVRVIGANYRHPAQEKDKFVAEYFRSKSIADHHSSCNWLDQKKVDNPITDLLTQARQAKRKAADFVTIFDLRYHRKNTENTINKPISTLSANSGPGAQMTRDGSPERSAVTGEIKTSDFERLVDSFIEARDTLSRAEFDSLTLKVSGRGDVRYKDFFRPVSRPNAGGVQYGGVKTTNNYGYGFSLEFFDLFKGKPINIYISSENLKKFKHHRWIKSSVDEVTTSAGMKYLQVYCIGQKIFSEQHGKWNIDVLDLRHFLLKVKKRKNSD